MAACGNQWRVRLQAAQTESMTGTSTRTQQAMLEMGQSRPWPEALYTLTGERQMDATAILDYFAPPKTWLDEQNKGKKVGV